MNFLRVSVGCSNMGSHAPSVCSRGLCSVQCLTASMGAPIAFVLAGVRGPAGNGTNAHLADTRIEEITLSSG